MRRNKKTVPVDGNDNPIDNCDLGRSFLESAVEGKIVCQSVDAESEKSTSQEGSSESQSVADDQCEVLSDIEENSVLRESMELDTRFSEHILASLNRAVTNKLSAELSSTAAKAAKPKSSKTGDSPSLNKFDVSGAEDEASSAKRTSATSEPGTAEPDSEADAMKSTPDENPSKRQQSQDEESTKKPSATEKDQFPRESVRESVAKKREQMRLLSKDSVAAKRLKAMQKFQEAGKGPCIAENCRDRGSFESEEQELDRLLKAEEEREAKLRERPDKCAGFVQRQFDKTAFKPSLYMNLYKEPIIVRRVRRKPAEPAAPKKESKPNKTSDLRYKYLHNQKIVSSNAAKHLEQFKRPPFKNPSKFGHSCNDRPAHFALAREAKETEKQLKKAKEQNKQMLQNRTTQAPTEAAHQEG